jgi:tetratricopeptide (TPR) repeat protein
MHLVPADGKGPGQPLAFTRAAASYRREADNLTTSRDGPHGAIDGDQSTKWDIWPQANHLHTAIFETRQAAGNSSQDLLVVQLDFRDRRSLGHGLGRFRLSATSQLNCARDENLIALARSAGHWTRLATAYVVRGDFERARAASQKAVAGPNSSTHDHLLACLIHEHLGQTVLADKDLDEAMQRVPDKAAVHGVADRLLMELAVDAISPRIAREPKDARLLMTRFRWLAVLGLPARALSDLDRARAVKSGETLTVNYYAPLHELAGAAVGRRDWPTVVRIHNELAALNPSDSWVRYRLATVQAYLGNKDEYRKVCNELLKKFEKNADLAVSEQIAKACQLIPDVVRDREGIARNAQAARTDPRNNLRGFYFLTTALTEYRAGRWAAAVEWCNKASEEKTWVEVAPAAGYVLAMTRFRQGEVAAARKMIADLSATPGLDGSWITRDNWQDWLIIFILRREAEQLISPELAPRPREVK